MPGYVFISTYRYLRFKNCDSADQTSYLLLRSVIYSFVIKTVFDFIARRSEIVSYSPVDTVCLFVIGVISGYACAWVVGTELASNVRDILKIARTPNENIWDDIITEDIWVRIWLKNSDRSYYGQVKYFEEKSREPIVLLEYYQFLNGDAEVLFDNTDDPKRKVVLNLSDFERIEIAER